MTPYDLANEIKKLTIEERMELKKLLDMKLAACSECWGSASCKCWSDDPFGD